jgi:hypothetical protein
MLITNIRKVLHLTPGETIVSARFEGKMIGDEPFPIRASKTMIDHIH